MSIVEGMYQFAYIDSYPTSLTFFTAEFSIFHKILLNVVISDLEVVHNFGLE